MTQGLDKNDVPRSFCLALEEYVAHVSTGLSLSRPLGQIVERALIAIQDVIAEETGNGDWLYFRVAAEGLTAQQIVKHHIHPLINQLRLEFEIAGWWWLGKGDSHGPAIRLRLQLPVNRQLDARQAMLAICSDRGLQCNPVPYEPELRLFGGPVGMELAHRIFCVDSEFLAQWMNEHPAEGSAIPAGLSLAIIFWLLASAGLDLFESWDVFGRICELRRCERHRPLELDLQCQRLASIVIGPRSYLTPDRITGQKNGLLDNYKREIHQLGRELEQTYFMGSLACGRRHFLVPVVLFHWNRIGLSAITQATLAAAVKQRLGFLIEKGHLLTASETYGS